MIPIEILAGYFFALVALLFLGLGQEMGRRFAIIENRMLAYSADILGSLAGIAVFGVMSFFRLPAYVWFAIAMALGVYFVPRRRLLHAMGGSWPWRSSPGQTGRWTRKASPPRSVVALLPGSLQAAVHVDRRQQYRPPGNAARRPLRCRATISPYLMNRDAGGKPFEDVLIIGAGSGNDVAAALAKGVKHVDAVEIDPVIQRAWAASIIPTSPTATRGSRFT